MSIVETKIHNTSDRKVGGYIEVENHRVKCVVSNVRNTSINWMDMSLQTSGVGFEGDLVLVEALSNTGSTVTVENQSGRDERIYKGDKFIGVLANRYSGTSESGGIPKDGIEIRKDKPLHLLSVGGVIGIATGIPPTKRPEPFLLEPKGLIAQNGKQINLVDTCQPWDTTLNKSAPIVFISGTSAEVGKTTASTAVIRAMKELGLRVAGTKFSGTGRMRDILSLRDAGADIWLDFPDVGLPTTYTGTERFIGGIYTLFNLINMENPDIIVAEAGGDPIEANVNTFLGDKSLMQYVSNFIIVSGDVMGMMGMRDYLRAYTQDIPTFATDPKGRNLYTTRERVKAEMPEVPIFNSLDPDETKKAVIEMLDGR